MVEREFVEQMPRATIERIRSLGTVDYDQAQNTVIASQVQMQISIGYKNIQIIV